MYQHFRILENMTSRIFLFTLHCLLFSVIFGVAKTSAHAQNRPMPLPGASQKTDNGNPPISKETQEAETVGSQTIQNDAYTGIVANQTITVAGQDFFQYFIAAWRDKDMVEKFEISISERPSARLGSQIWINYGQRRVFQTFLPAARAAIKPISLAAADAVYEGIVQADVQRLLFRDPDLGPDEF